MGNPYKILNWLGAIAFVLAFIDSQNWFVIGSITEQQDLWIMMGASAISFFLGNQIRWLGLAIVLVGLALQQGWISLNLGNVSFNPIFIILSGYLMLFFNSK